MCRRLMRSPARRPLDKGTPTTGIRVFSDAVLLGFPGRVFCAVSQKELGREVSVQAALFIQLGAQTLDFRPQEFYFFWGNSFGTNVSLFHTKKKKILGYIGPKFGDAPKK